MLVYCDACVFMFGVVLLLRWCVVVCFVMFCYIAVVLSLMDDVWFVASVLCCVVFVLCCVVMC